MTRNNYLMPKIQILPTLNCQAACSYCFGPHMKSTLMPGEIVRKTAEWIDKLAEQADFGPSGQKVNIIFHGGEPLLAGHDFYNEALSTFERNIGKPVSFSLISNLWAFDKEYAEIFKKHGVAIAVSLDGPEDINDRQRGEGYYKRTMAGLRLARNMDIPVSAICTFTPLSAPRADEIFDFFLEQKLDFLFKTVVEPFEIDDRKIETLSYEEHICLVERLLTRFLEHAGQIRIKSLERLVRSIVTRENSLYISGNCLGKQFAVDPYGGIYNCQRFAGIKKFQMASVDQVPSMGQLMSTPGYCTFSARIGKVGEECLECPYFDICSGGCAYNAFAGQTRENTGSLKDPQCKAYAGILDNMVRLVGEVMSGSLETGKVKQTQKKVLYMLLQGIPLSLLYKDAP